MLSEKRVVLKGVYAGTIDIVCGVDDFECDVKFDEEKHQYTEDGEELPSVTQLLEDNCYEYVKPEVLQRAAQRGTEIHHEIEMFIKKGEMGKTQEFREFYRIYLENEDIFNSKCVMDIKTYNVMGKEQLKKVDLQTQMYIKALKDTINSKDKFDAYCIWLPKDKKGKLIKL